MPRKRTLLPNQKELTMLVPLISKSILLQIMDLSSSNVLMHLIRGNLDKFRTAAVVLTTEKII